MLKCHFERRMPLSSPYESFQAFEYKREERWNNVGKTAVIFPQISRETLGALVHLLGITRA